MRNNMRWRALVATTVTVLVCACGGGGSGDEPAAPPPPPPTSAGFLVGGTVSGLGGGSVEIRNGTESLTVTSNGTFRLPGKPAGTVYALTVGQQPAGQVCTVANGSGTVQAEVSNVVVTCVAATATEPVPGIPQGLTVSYDVKRYTFRWTAATNAASYQVLEDADGPGPLEAVPVGKDIATTTFSLELKACCTSGSTRAIR